MVNKLRKMLKSEKGFTLVELLAVIVILGIIAAIAVPAVGSIIDNSKKDAHISNAKMIYEAARLYDVSEDVTSTKGEIELSTLQNKGYLNNDIKAPSGEGYDGTSFVDLSSEDVKLLEDNHSASGTIETLAYIDTTNDAADTVFNLEKSDVDLQD